MNIRRYPLWYPADGAAAPASSAPAEPPAPAAPAAAPQAAEPKAGVPAAAPTASAPPEPAKPAASLVGTDTKPPEAALFDLKALKAPEGFKLDDKEMNAFGELMTKHKVGTEAAQGLLEMHAGVVKTAQAALVDNWKKTNDDWVKAVKADPEIGGAKFESVRQNISKVIDQYGSKELREALDLTGAGNHPAVIKFLAKVSASLTEGKPLGTAGGAPASGRTRSPASIMYPSMNGEAS